MLEIMLGILILFLWLAIIPTIVGTLSAIRVDKYKRNLLFRWISGQILLWAVFQLAAVPVILLQTRLEPFLWKLEITQFELLQIIYLGAVTVLVAGSLGYYVWERKKHKTAMHLIKGYNWQRELLQNKWQAVLWGIFWLLLIFQLVQAVRMTYGDGDDAFYVAVSSIAEESGTMYQKLPYTGGSTGLDIRHGLAPFPIWIAFLAVVSGIPSVSVAHVAAPLALISMTYGIYYLIGEKICGRKQELLPLFLVFTEILVLFGDYSFYTVENFMIARSRQGKAALGSIVIPMAFFVLFMILERIQENRRVERIWWLLLSAVMITGCLCSTLGAVLLCVLTGVAGICCAVCYRRWKILIPMLLCCVPAVCYALIYLLAEA